MDASKEIDSTLKQLQRYDSESLEVDNEGNVCLFDEVKVSLEKLKHKLELEVKSKRMDILITVKPFKISSESVEEAIIEGMKEALK